MSLSNVLIANGVLDALVVAGLAALFRPAFSVTAHGAHHVAAAELLAPDRAVAATADWAA